MLQIRECFRHGHLHSAHQIFDQPQTRLMENEKIHVFYFLAYSIKRGADDFRLMLDHLLPNRAQEVPEADKDNPIRLGYLRMDGREIFKFAVSKFREVIADALEKTGLTADDISQIVCHQSNARIIENAIEKLKLPRDKVLINIDQYGNSSSGSVGLCLDQVWRAGKVPAGKPMILVAFGGGVTWASNVWNV